MTLTGEYSDTLRALGRFLETAGASDVSILDLGHCLEVSWRGKGANTEQRRYKEFELRALRTRARLFRGSEDGSPPFTMSEMLRILGQELDDTRAEAMGLTERSDGFYLWAQVNGAGVGRVYTFEELMARPRDRSRTSLRPEVVGFSSPRSSEPSPAPRTPLRSRLASMGART